MKHPKIRRFIRSALVLVLILSVLPLSAMAYQTLIYNKFYDSADARFADEDNVVYREFIDALEDTEDGGFTIGILESGLQLEHDGKLYEFMGFGSRLDPDLPCIDNGVTSVTIPELPENATGEEERLWLLRYSELTAAYAPVQPKDEPDKEPDKKPEAHVHVPDESRWFNSDTNHWRICKTCGQYCSMDWHHDENGDGKCDQCGMTILRYPIKVLECEGGRITVSQKDGAYRDVVDVTVETNPGYAFKQIHFFKLDEKRHELIRWEDVHGSRYHFDMPFYEVEIEAEFVKQ